MKALLAISLLATTICLSDYREEKQITELPEIQASSIENFKNGLIKDTFLSAKKEYIESLVSIKIIYHDKEQTYLVPCDSVGNTLKRLNIQLEKDDVIGLDLSDTITENQTIVVTKIEYQQATRDEIIPYETQKINADDMLVGESQIVQQGHNGLKTCTYKTIYLNDKPWHVFKTSESIIRPAVNEIIKTGTQNILETINADLKNQDTVLLKTKVDDNGFSLPKIELSENNRDLLERIVTGEFGGSFIGSCLIAQAIKCAIVYDGYTSIKDVIVGMGYVGDTDQKSQNAVEAVNFIFDENGLAVKHRLFYMCTEDYYDSEPGNFHSTQNFILQYENVKFFDRW